MLGLSLGFNLSRGFSVTLASKPKCEATPRWASGQLKQDVPLALEAHGVVVSEWVLVM